MTNCTKVGVLLCILTLFVGLPTVPGARILAMFPLGAKSHQGYLQTVARTLARAGHEVEVYSPFPDLMGPQPANLTHFHLQAIRITDKDMLEFIVEITEYPFWKCMDLMWDYSVHLYDEFAKDKEIERLMKSGKHFDLIIAEIFNAQEFSLLLSHKFNAPVIGLQAFPTNNVLNMALGNPLSISFIPDTCTSLPHKMTFIERAMNAYSSLRALYYHYTYYHPRLESMIRKDFPGVPPIQELTNNVSLMFVNDHLTADYAQPRTPNIIPIGGIHIQPPSPLPKNIQEFMDTSTDGVIFFSLGTYVPDELKPKEYFDTYINVFKNLKQRVLWKTRKLDIEGLPENVLTLSWAPQKDILAHPKCVLFITHGGQNSLLEAIHFGVPVISIPQFFDQHRNSEFYVQMGVGEKIPIKEVSERTMSAALHKVLFNPSYKENMQRLSAVFRDRPLSPAESVVFWTEYVLRHGGAAHLRPASTELRWYQSALLDVTALVLVVVLSILAVIYLCFKRLYCLTFQRNTVFEYENKKLN